jgi:uncharacterized membrane protein
MPYRIERSLTRGGFLCRITLICTTLLFVSACGGGSDGNAPPVGDNTPPDSGEAQTDRTPPSPPTSLAGAATSPSEINLSWSGATDNVAVAGYKVYRGGVVIATVTNASHTESGLTASTQYCYDVSALDAAGNESAHSAQTCATTAALADTTPPTLTSTSPVDAAADVAVDVTLNAVFAEAMDAATLNTATFLLKDASDNPVSGTVTYTGATASFVSAEILAPRETYTATITVGAKDAAGNPLATNYSWTFETGLAAYEITAIDDDPADGDEVLFTLVTDLNEKGEIAGEAIRTSEDSEQESIAFLWREGRLIDLGALNTAVRESRAQGINDRSEAIGWSYPPENGRPGFLWREEKMSAIDLDDAYAINNAGQVVGYINRVQDAELISVPVAWNAGQITELRGLENPWNINDAGDIVGFSYVALQPQAALWRAGVVTHLGLLPGAFSSQAFDVNREGLIVGTNEFAPPAASSYERAFLWQSGDMMELPRLADDHSSSNAEGINDRGDVVGRSGADAFSATIWLDSEPHNLNDLIASDDPLKPYVTLLEAREINNRGQIIAQGTDSRRSGSFTGYLLTPKRALNAAANSQR